MRVLILEESEIQENDVYSKAIVSKIDYEDKINLRCSKVLVGDRRGNKAYLYFYYDSNDEWYYEKAENLKPNCECVLFCVNFNSDCKSFF